MKHTKIATVMSQNRFKYRVYLEHMQFHRVDLAQQNYDTRQTLHHNRNHWPKDLMQRRFKENIEVLQKTYNFMK